MSSYLSIDEESADIIDALDADMLVPLDVSSDVPFRPRLTEVKVQPFLRAMLKCAPPTIGRNYVQRSISETHGEPRKLQRLAGIWFNRIILLGALLECGVSFDTTAQAHTTFSASFHSSRTLYACTTIR